jgi:D-alanyl-D-alanine carboxypeptidase
LRRSFALVALLYSAFAFAQATAPPPADTLAARLDAALAPLFREDQPGGAVILTREGRWVFRKGYGLADREREIAIRPEMPFRIGSVTKQLTAAGILLLADEGKLALSDDVTRFLPDYPAHGKRITVEHLLAHASGIRSDIDMPIEPGALAIERSVQEIIGEFKSEPLRFEPGEAISYSNSNYMLLGAIIEKASGMRYADFMAARIFEPLGMRSTAYEGYERDGSLRVEGYQRGRSKPLEKALPIHMSQPFAAGGLVSSVDDLARWGEAIDRRRLLSPESWKRMFRPFVLNDGRISQSCFGWFVERRKFGREVFQHAGGINGFVSFVYWVPQERIFIAVLLNSTSTPASAAHIAQTMLYLALQR